MFGIVLSFRVEPRNSEDLYEVVKCNLVLAVFSVQRKCRMRKLSISIVRSHISVFSVENQTFRLNNDQDKGPQIVNRNNNRVTLKRS